MYTGRHTHCQTFHNTNSTRVKTRHTDTHTVKYTQRNQIYTLQAIEEKNQVQPTRPQSTDRFYTVFGLLKSLGELLTHSQWTGFKQYFAY